MNEFLKKVIELAEEYDYEWVPRACQKHTSGDVGLTLLFFDEGTLVKKTPKEATSKGT